MRPDKDIEAGRGDKERRGWRMRPPPPKAEAVKTDEVLWIINNLSDGVQNWLVSWIKSYIIIILFCITKPKKVPCSYNVQCFLTVIYETSTVSFNEQDSSHCYWILNISRAGHILLICFLDCFCSLFFFAFKCINGSFSLGIYFSKDFNQRRFEQVDADFDWIAISQMQK